MILILIIALIIAIYKWFIYYCTVRGLLYYLGDRYSDMPNFEKVKELTIMAVERTIKEFIGKA
ncbi:MAG: hypothetical protein E7I47_16415 [Clostridium sp.]|uniref:hypothetical protein n=1 Tax=Clostridium sp. TaxID=1506 RepID=UPI00290FF1BA|nr:hypothetical protein [Clostridium sp.]MDU4320879.1 hypothetical protein [Clostridium sp.]